MQGKFQKICENDQVNDSIVGYVDMGNIERIEGEANDALAFMLTTVKSEWKQSIIYYFCKNRTKVI